MENESVKREEIKKILGEKNESHPKILQPAMERMIDKSINSYNAKLHFLR